MTLKEQIKFDFIIALKARDERKKNALNMLKAKILVAEKANSNIELDDAQTLSVIVSDVKQRRQSIEEFKKGERAELVEKEEEELKAIEAYMPAQLTRDQILMHAKDIMATLPHLTGMKLVGTTTGEMNKKFKGQFDNATLQSVLKEINS